VVAAILGMECFMDSRTGSDNDGDLRRIEICNGLFPVSGQAEITLWMLQNCARIVRLPGMLPYLLAHVARRRRDLAC
jgi:hypothetical protein